MIAARQGDGRFGPSPVGAEPGARTLAAARRPDRAPILDPTPWVGGVKPFVLQSSSQFRTAGPNALSSGRLGAGLQRGQGASARRTAPSARPTQTYIARWWQSNPVASWNDVAPAARRTERPRRSPTRARLLAMQNLSGADASINCWNDKYHWDFWRPWNAIPRAAEDGNPATDARPDLDAADHGAVPRTPVRAHLPRRRAHARPADVLRRRARRAASRSRASPRSCSPADPRTRSFASFSQALAELIEARIWAGLHFRTADVQGQALGRNVADYMAANYFQRLGTFGGS